MFYLGCFFIFESESPSTSLFKGTWGRFCVGFVEKMNLHLTYFIANERMKRPKMKTKRLHTNVCVMTTRLWVAKTVAVQAPSLARRPADMTYMT